jgi:hypothetical protein
MRFALFNPITVVLVLLAAVLLTACGSSSRATVNGDDLLQLRRYRLRLADPDPQASWSPSGSWILARWGRGLTLLREGARQQFRLDNARRPGHPVWMSDNLIAVGDEEWFTKTDEGRIIMPSQSIRLFDVKPGTGITNPRDLADASGWRPRPWQGKIVVQSANTIRVYDELGNGQPYDEAFFPAPQRNGAGMIVQSLPVIAEDHWTGHAGLGELVIRWPDAPTQLVPACVEARWTPQGGVIATRLLETPPAEQPWWQADCELVHIPEPGAEPVVILPKGYWGDAHPTLPIIAGADSGNNVVLVHADGGGVIREVAQDAARPQWSSDGDKLCFEVPSETKSDSKDLMIVVYQLR